MGTTTPNLGMYLPGGGSTGTHGADETADVDKINGNFDLIDTAYGAMNAIVSGLSSPIAINKGGTGATTASAARTSLGATTIGATIFTAADADAVLTALGVTTIGKALFTAASVDAARAALEIYITNTEPVGKPDGAVWGAWTP